MKTRATLLIGAITLASLVAVWLGRAPDRHRSVLSPSAAKNLPTATTLQKTAVPPSPPAASRTPNSVDHMLAAQEPQSLAKVMGTLKDLQEADIARLIEVLRSGSALHRRAVIELLASRTDPEGRVLAALKQASYDGDPFVAHAALDALASYAVANPAAARDVTSFLLDRSINDADIETRAVAIGALSFDHLDETDLMSFSHLLSNPEESIREAAIDCAADSSLQHRSNAVKVLTAAFYSAPSKETRIAVLDCLASLDPTALNTLRGVSNEVDEVIDEILKRE